MHAKSRDAQKKKITCAESDRVLQTLSAAERLTGSGVCWRRPRGIRLKIWTRPWVALSNEFDQFGRVFCMCCSFIYVSMVVMGPSRQDEGHQSRALRLLEMLETEIRIQSLHVHGGVGGGMFLCKKKWTWSPCSCYKIEPRVTLRV